MKPFFSWLITLIYPERCFVCGRVIPWQTQMCRECEEKAPYILPPVCSLCGRGEERCSCGKHARSFERCVSPFYFEGALHTGIWELKSTGGRPYVNGFALEMGEVIRREYGGISFDTITAVPLFPEDEYFRGFNPAALLAKELAKALAVPYAPALIKLVHTPPQKELTAARRAGNLLGAFDVTEDVNGKTVLLVDDVITTGSTLEECAKMLKLYGAEEVYGVTAAAAVLSKEENSV